MRAAPVRRARSRVAVAALGAAATLALAPNCGSATAQDLEALCAAQLPPGEVRVQAVHAVPRVSYALSAHDLWQRLGARRGSVALGMTETGTSVAMEVTLHRAISEDGLVSCVRPEIDVVLSHSAIEVRLAAEIEDDACVAQAVLDHEMTHVAIEHATLEEAARTLGAQMRDYYRERVLHGEDSQITAELAWQFEREWAPALRALLGASALQHAEHDERDSYGDRETCEGALIAIARRIE